MLSWFRRYKPGGIFLSYRREETAQAAGRLSDRLKERFGAERVFIDVESIGLGLDFVEVITKAVGSCDLLLALIGNEWLTSAEDQGRRRLDDDHDYVRIEIEAALQRNVRVVPVLIDGARMPRTEELPPSLHALVRRQALKLNHEDFGTQASRLIEEVAPLLPWAPRRSKKDATPVSEEGPRVTVLSEAKDNDKISLALLLKEAHRIDISVGGGVRLDGKRVKGAKFAIQDAERTIPASCLVSTSMQSSHTVYAAYGAQSRQFEKIILIVDGATVWEL